LEDIAVEAQPSNEGEIINYGVRCARLALEAVIGTDTETCCDCIAKTLLASLSTEGGRRG
jgi:hypothetical protein